MFVGAALMMAEGRDVEIGELVVEVVDFLLDLLDLFLTVNGSSVMVAVIILIFMSSFTFFLDLIDFLEGPSLGGAYQNFFLSLGIIVIHGAFSNYYILFLLQILSNTQTTQRLINIFKRIRLASMGYHRLVSMNKKIIPGSY